MGAAAEPLPATSPLQQHAVKTEKPASGVVSQLNYAAPPPPGEHAFFMLRAHRPGDDPRKTNFGSESQPVHIKNMRVDQADFSLRESGFTLERLVVPSDIDWTNNEDASSRLIYRDAMCVGANWKKPVTSAMFSSSALRRQPVG